MGRTTDAPNPPVNAEIFCVAARVRNAAARDTVGLTVQIRPALPLEFTQSTSRHCVDDRTAVDAAVLLFLVSTLAPLTCALEPKVSADVNRRGAVAVAGASVEGGQ